MQKIKQIQALLPRLNPNDLDHILAFVEYLHHKGKETAQPITIIAPETIERPDKETVIGAIKRLSKTYPMLDKSKMLNQTSLLMTQHMTLGRDIVEVIDELEQVFAQHYDQYKQNQEEIIQ